MIALVVIANLMLVSYAQTQYNPTEDSALATTTIPSVNHEQVTSNRLSYSGSQAILPVSSLDQRSAIGQDEFGGHTIQHSANSAFSNPNSGDTDVKQNRYIFHINPYAGQASISTDDAIGGINPDYQSASFYHRRHNAVVNPAFGHGSYANTADSVAVSPQGNNAYQVFRSGSGNAFPTGFYQNRRLSQLSHANHPQFGGFTNTQFLNRNAIYTPGQVNYRDEVQHAGQGQDRFGHGDIVNVGATRNVNLDTGFGVGTADHTSYTNQFRYNPYFGATHTSGQVYSQGFQNGPVFVDQKK